MTDDQFWRIVTTSIGLAVVGAFRDPIMRFMYRIGYRPMKSRDISQRAEPDKYGAEAPAASDEGPASKRK